jgi:hypothetical protein
VFDCLVYVFYQLSEAVDAMETKNAESTFLSPDWALSRWQQSRSVAVPQLCSPLYGEESCDKKSTVCRFVLLSTESSARLLGITIVRNFLLYKFINFLISWVTLSRRVLRKRNLGSVQRFLCGVLECSKQSRSPQSYRRHWAVKTCLWHTSALGRTIICLCL